MQFKVTVNANDPSDLLWDGPSPLLNNSFELETDLELIAQITEGQAGVKSVAAAGEYTDLYDLVQTLNDSNVPQYSVSADENGVFLQLDPDTAFKTINGSNPTGTVNVVERGDFDLSETEFGLVDSTESTLVSTEIGMADNVASLLNSVFDFSGDTPNADINTTIFAITASDDASETAIWAHTQSSADDATVDALELNLLGTVETVGDGAGNEEFGIENFAVADGAGGWDILSEPTPV